MSRSIEKLLCETRQVFQALAEASDEALRSRGLSAHEQGLLKVLARSSGPVTVTVLARATLATVRETDLAVAALRDRDLVTCQAEPLDSRSTTVALSPLGHSCCVELLADERSLIERLTASLDAQAVQSTLATLREVRRLLRRASEFAPHSLSRIHSQCAAQAERAAGTRDLRTHTRLSVP